MAASQALAAAEDSGPVDAATIRRLTCFDSLTGLPNRLLFREQLALMTRIARRGTRPLAVLLADVDDFRRLKLSLGQRGGDLLVRTIGTRIAQCLRDSDLVAGGHDASRSLARLNGNEFALVLNALADPHDAQRVARRLRDAVAAPLTIGGVELRPTLSIGVALSPGDGGDADTLIEHADIALGRAKDLGKDCVQFYDESMNAQAASRVETEAALRRAVDEHGLFAVYQPCVDSRDGSVRGFEALVRWRHPERGVLLPEHFVALAEQSRLIVPLGDFMLETACRQNREWQRRGLPPVPVAVNVSALQVARPEFVTSVRRALERSGLAPQWLELELTETMLMNDAAGALRTVTALKALGVRIAIDDFGTGFSSLAYLRDLPVDVLKIDRSFVSGLPGHARTAGVTCAIVDLACRLGLEVVAEGVETTAQRDFLRANGCTLVQGYLYSQPLAADAAEAYWREAAQGVPQAALAG